MQCEETLYPKTYEEVQEIVKNAMKEGSKIHVFGFGKNHLGRKVQANICLSTKNLNKILEISNSDLYVTVQAGVDFQELQEELNKRNLFLPLTYSGSVGGLASTNFPSLFSLPYPYPKDLILGAKIVTGLGELIKSGSKTTKFSSGYKIWKALSGSLGWLGVYVELTFRLIGKPERLAFAKISNDKLKENLDKFILERPWGIIYTEKESYLIFGGFSRYLEHVERAYGIKFEDGLPNLNLDCEKIYGIVTERGNELEVIKRIEGNKVIGYIGAGYVRSCSNPGMEVIIEKGCEENEQCFPHYETGRLLKQALDPYNIFVTTI